MNRFSRNTRHEKHIPLGAPANPGGSTPITGNTFAAGASGIAATPANAQGLQGAFGQQYVEVLLSSAQILALQTTPVTIVPAYGVGFFIKPTSIKMILLAGSAAYTDAGGAVSFSVGSLSMALSANTIFLVTTSPSRRIQLVSFDAAAVGVGVLGTAANPPTEDNAPLNISKATNNFAAGNGTMKICVYYTVENSL